MATATTETKYSLSELYALWRKLGNVPTVPDGDNVETLEEPFLHFSAGMPCEDVWHWFEAQHPDFVVGEVMEGIRRTHWAYLEGREAGLKGERTKCGIMAFGLGCAADAQTESNTRHWLKGFDNGEKEAKKLAEVARAAPPADSWAVTGRKPPRSGHPYEGM